MAINGQSDLSSESSLDDWKRIQVAYFTMEIAVAPNMPTYSGGLGVLAGDTIRSAADTGLPLAAVTLLHRKGYFHQHLNAEGMQTEEDEPWKPETLLQPLETLAAITIQGRPVMIRAWRFDVVGTDGHIIPVFLLDTDLEGNDLYDRRLTDHLYGGDTYYRLCQETVLGLGGVALLTALGCHPEVYHMNEGHAALLGHRPARSNICRGTPLACYRRRSRGGSPPVRLHHPHSSSRRTRPLRPRSDVRQVLGTERRQALERFGCLHDGMLNMTYVALRFSRYVNGVAMQHGKVSREMFPDYPVHAITNGVHAATWLSQPMQALLR